MMESTKKNDAKNIGAILLAAGQSSRLGTPKQLLSYEGTTIFQHILQTAIASNAHPIVVVLGAHADIIEKKIDRKTAQVVVNVLWPEGMASSIRQGIQTLLEINPFAEGAILITCDQPYVTTSLLNDLIEARQNTGKPIITCSYADTFGPPTLFHKSIFPELVQLKGDIGARSILRHHADKVEAILFPEGKLDIDTNEDYEKLLKNNRET